jgi:hypothetical protein
MTPVPLPEVISRLNRTLLGWTNYVHHSNGPAALRNWVRHDVFAIHLLPPAGHRAKRGLCGASGFLDVVIDGHIAIGVAVPVETVSDLTELRQPVLPA